MKRTLLPLASLLVVACGCAQLAALSGPQEAPFVIPPAGKAATWGGDLPHGAPSALAFDRRNRPVMLHTRDAETSGFLLALRDGAWQKRSFVAAVRAACPGFVSFLATREHPHLHELCTLTVDDADALYAILTIRERDRQAKPVLLYSPDLGETFQCTELPGGPDQAFLEVRVGHNDLSQPPAVGLLSLRKRHPARWTDYYRLSIAAPVKQGDRLAWPEPARVTDACFGVSNHSGGASFAVTTGRRTHFVFAEIPPKKEVGNPTYAATYDRERGTVVHRQFLVAAPPREPDVHSTPVIAADSRGGLHVVAGAHGQHFLYLRSLRPDRTDAGWTEPARVGQRQTYAALVCDPEDRLHLVFREWRKCATLCIQSKAAGADAWPPSEALVYAPGKQPGYGIFYHRLFVDRRGALFVSFTFNAQRGGRYPRALLLSEDRGRTWRFATTADLVRRITPEK